MTTASDASIRSVQKSLHDLDLFKVKVANEVEEVFRDVITELSEYIHNHKING